MNAQEITDSLGSPDPDVADQMVRALANKKRRRSHHLQIIASLFANGHEAIARQYAEETGIDIKPTNATNRAISRLGSAAERRSADSQRRQRLQQLENSDVWQLILRTRETPKDRPV